MSVFPSGFPQQLFVYNFTFTLLISVEAIIFMTPLQDVDLEQVGLKAVFECEISKAGLKPEWFKGDKPIRRSEKYDKTSDNGKHALIIEESQAEDEGPYTVKFEDVTSTAKLTINGQFKERSSITVELIVSCYLFDVPSKRIVVLY